MPHSVLVLHRSPEFLREVRPALKSLSLPVTSASAAEPAENVVRDGPPDLVVVDFGPGSAELRGRLAELRQRAESSAILAVVDPSAAGVAAELLGPVLDDYVLGPPDAAELLARCRRGLAGRDLHRRLDLLQVELNRRYGAHRIVCRSNAMQAAYHRVLQLAPRRTTVLVVGESGAGKELVARSLHYNSGRRDQPFVAMNCAAIADTLIESELFGHDRGAFTGAVETVPGKFELADGGTIFLDEVGSMGPAAQVRLLRVLEEGEFMRVGGKRTIRVDVRVVAATNTDLEDQVTHGEFRKDLLYRLKVAVIEVPPLRQRQDDIPVLARTFVSQLCDENGLPPKEISPEAVRLLSRHSWPGNVRELKNLLESLVVTVPDVVLRPEHVRQALGDAAPAPGLLLPSPGLTLAEVERLHVEQTLRAHGGNRTQAARTLGIGLRTLQRKIKEHGIDVPWQPPVPS